MKVALVALALAAVPMGVGVTGTARAEVNITVNPGDVAFGYSDGYWDRDHHWHAWRDQNEAEWYRTHYAQHYVAQRHDRERDQGWHDSDRWWDRR
jgi:hypothetical protein